MSLTYYDIITLTFGESEFTSDELAARTGSTRAPKLLNELKMRGYVMRTARGRYRALKPSERPDLRENEWNRARKIILAGPEPKAWTGASAVELWTGMRYCLAPSVYLREFHIAIPEGRSSMWKNYLRSSGVPTGGKRKIGVIVKLYPSRNLRIEHLLGEPVISREETVRIIREHPSLYASAEGLLIS
ncbi:MAG: hypothetical protein KHF84_07520 [Thermoplasmata archaeon]|nr:hypothetical protein [Candidatus Sysuiplasma jiujiangense]